MERNWAGNVTYRAARIAHPESLDELRGAMATGPIRMLGSRHSFNEIGDTGGTLIALDRMPRTIEISAARDAVKVAGGLRYGDIAPALEAQGLQLENLASLPHISVAGAVATGTHGSGDRVGTLAAAVRAVTIMTPAGDIRSLTRGGEGFDGAVVNLGALGAVVDLTLDVGPAAPYAQRVYEEPSWDAILADLDAVTSAGTSVSIFTRWGRTDAADQVWVKQRGAGDANLDAAMRRLGATPAAEKRHPIIGVGAEACTDQFGAPGPWYERLPHFRLDFTPSAGAEIQSEYLVPRADAVAAIEAVRSLAGVVSPHLLVNEIRTMRADELWLSPAYGADAVGLHFTWKADADAVLGVLPVLEAALPPSARPHWGKVSVLPAADVRARFPRWADFSALAAEFDPERRLVNEHLAALGL
ncbi:FAD-binding protein [Microbacterium halophytorum]|uniref:FAD-binding protein n=1 Tax=Microbacterium halophytorum TaxID=2067568 RepID=UPI000CFCD125|nr:FAD-binding protein [Microbacterium halophytorum]